MSAQRGAFVQGKPVARRGRKARDLPPGRPPGCRSPSSVHTKRWEREVEPGALHRGAVAPCDTRLDPGRWRQVVLAMNVMFVASTDDQSTDTMLGPDAGHRWN